MNSDRPVGFAGISRIRTVGDDSAARFYVEKMSVPPSSAVPVARVKTRDSKFLGTWTPGAKFGVGLIAFFVLVGIWQAIFPAPAPAPVPVSLPAPLYFSEPVSGATSLGFSQICWCRRESIVLDRANANANALSQRKNFRAIVNDAKYRIDRYNSKCANKNYYQSDGQLADSRASEIRAAADKEYYDLVHQY